MRYREGEWNRTGGEKEKLGDDGLKQRNMTEQKCGRGKGKGGGKPRGEKGEQGKTEQTTNGDSGRAKTENVELGGSVLSRVTCHRG